MNRIKFAEDWDKLSEPRFTTIRSYNPEKEAYYRAQIGREFTVLRVSSYWSYRGKKIGTATLRSVRVLAPRNLLASELATDVLRGGRPDPWWMKRLLAMDRALVLEFENHTGILAEA